MKTPEEYIEDQRKLRAIMLVNIIRMEPEHRQGLINDILERFPQTPTVDQIVEAVCEWYYGKFDVNVTIKDSIRAAIERVMKGGEG